MPEETGDEGLSAVETFDLLGDETRLSIIRELAEERRKNWQRRGRGFAELRKAVGINDAGTFSYHLDALQDHFVEKRGDEYILTESGLEIADAVLAGAYGTDGESKCEPTEYGCPDCDESLVAMYEDELIALRCPEHGTQVATTLAPGAIRGRSMEEILAVAARDMQQDIEWAENGVCFHCWGRMHTTIQLEHPFEHPATGRELDPENREGPLAIFGCERCDTVFWLPPSGCMTRHPATIAFVYDHGFDIMDALYTGGEENDTYGCRVESTDPIRVEVWLEIEEEELVLTLDGQADVVNEVRK